MGMAIQSVLGEAIVSKLGPKILNRNFGRQSIGRPLFLLLLAWACFVGMGKKWVKILGQKSLGISLFSPFSRWATRHP